MPIKTATSRLQEYSSNKKYHNTALSIATAISKVCGSDIIMEGEADGPWNGYTVSMENIGYPGWGVSIVSSNVDSWLSFRVDTLLSSGHPNPDDKNAAVIGGNNANAFNDMPYVPETCTMIYDENKDTVLFDVHPGETERGEDVFNKTSRNTSLTFFFARDVNNDVVCGNGFLHISKIRTKDSLMDDSTLKYSSISPKKPSYGDLYLSGLHLTKMVNYLSPGYPEMKSAYISVTRPLENIEGIRYISKLYADGKRWARTGLADSWNIASYIWPNSYSYYPIEPFVNY